ncbi:hypothetical protein [Methylobacterium nigriterrae]|uniref:hypothetical protein n=1 Tax=Methylobacterium nigriterrae TaxID=3127512 RepID=UPI00301328C2
MASFLATSTPTSPLAALRAYLRQRRNEFTDLRAGLLPVGADPHAVLGFVHEHRGQLEYLFTDERFATIVGGTAAAQHLKKELQRLGFLIVTAAGGQGTRYVAKRRLVAGGERQSVVAVAARILDP